MGNILAPSILSADFARLGDAMAETHAGGAAYIHFDVMDGMFVPNISFGMPVLKSIRKATPQVMDVHLMIEEPVRYVEDFAKAGADYITVHVEACSDPKATLEKIRAAGIKTGLSIKPGTSPEEIKAYLPLTDMVLVMSVEPGFGGQKFMPDALEKIRVLRTYEKEMGLHFDIEVDGGITLENARSVIEAGANVLVAGSAVFKGDAKANAEKFMEILNGGK